MNTKQNEARESIATPFLNAVSSSKFLSDWPFDRGLSSGASSHVRLSVRVTNLSFVSHALIQWFVFYTS